MTNRTDELIIEIGKEALFFSEAEEKWRQEFGDKLQSAALVLQKFRDTLMAIAQCQGDIASHQAQDVLKEAGYCYHEPQTYRADPIDDAYQPADMPGKWRCADCGESGIHRLVPYR